MPSPAPSLSPADLERLIRLGEQLRATRKAQKVAAATTAEAAGLSRVTLHRVERGEPSVTIGSWVAVAAALGLEFALADPKVPPPLPALPDRISLDEYPQLKQLAWHLSGAQHLSPQDALAIYERNWRHMDRRALSMKEIALINALATVIGGGRPLV